MGGGDSVGAIDLAIQREKFTDFPMAAGSGIKGAVRSWFELQSTSESKFKIPLIFGPEHGSSSEHAGAISFSDARILLFPIRSVKGVFAWATCLDVLHRLKRDAELTDLNLDLDIPTDGDQTAIVSPNSELLIDGNKLALEEYTFDAKEIESVKDIARWIADNALPQTEAYSYWRKRLVTHLVILPNDDFRDFTKHSTEVQTRISIVDETGTAKDGSLFYQENLPSESLMYSVVFAQRTMSKTIEKNLDEDVVMDYLSSLNGQHLQIGGDSSIGKGMMSVVIK